MISEAERAIIFSNPLLRSRAEFMVMAREVCEEVGVDAAMVFNPLRGNDVVVAARDAIIKIAHCRGYPARKIAMMIGRDTSSVLHSLKKAKLPPDDETAIMSGKCLQFPRNQPELKRGEAVFPAPPAPNRDLIAKGSRNG